MKKKSLVKILISMCVYLASHGLIASHLAIYKQASLKNNERVKSINTGSRWGNWGMVGRGGTDGKSAALHYFEWRGCRMTLWSSPHAEDRADIVQDGSLSSGCRVGPLLICCCSVICTGEHRLTQSSCDLGWRLEASFCAPLCRTPAPHLRKGSLGCRQSRPKCLTFRMELSASPFRSLFFFS